MPQTMRMDGKCEACHRPDPEMTAEVKKYQAMNGGRLPEIPVATLRSLLLCAHCRADELALLEVMRNDREDTAEPQSEPEPAPASRIIRV